jgi:superfamily II DNA/RNA helicase
MKRYLFAAVGIMVVLGMVLVCLGQEGEQPAGRAGRAGGGGRGMMRGYGEAQQQALNAIEEEVKKMKAAAQPPAGGATNFQEMSEEERAQMRERFTKMREERDKSIAAIQEQLDKLKGARALTTAHDEEIAKLKALSEQAKKENATETAAAIDKMIADKDKAFNEMLTKLGMERSTGGRGQRPGGGGGGRRGGGEN